MKRHLLTACLMISTISVTGGVVAQLQAAPPFPFFGSQKGEAAKAQINWQKDIFTAHKLAQQQNKPMLLVFGADWCGFCKKLEAQTLTQPQLADYINKNFIPVHLDADKDQKVTQILDVESLPCTIVLSPTADLMGRIDGFFAPEPFYRKLVAAKTGPNPVQPVSQVKAE